MTSPRPFLHFTPSWNWMNDPNGLVFHDGVYHLFFQHNPYGNSHANMSWGHASSTDLLIWEEHPVAIACDDDEQIYSGSVVVDEDNTSGLGGPGEVPLVAVYTSLSAVTGIQAQSIAYSIDAGLSWVKYDANPVLDRGSRHFRDPKVFRYQGDARDYWVMAAVEAEEHQVLFYRSDDLTSWTFLSSFGPAGAVGGVWECPDLFRLPVDGDPHGDRWVLLVSLNPGAVAGGSGTQYFVGRFDGERFSPDDEAPLSVTSRELAGLDWVDYGRDCYAGVTFNGLGENHRVLIAWMNNWDYARDFPSTRWRGTMTLPRRLSLREVAGRPQLCAEPILPEGEEIARISGVALTQAIGEVMLPHAARVDLRLTLSDETSVVASLRTGAADEVAVVRYFASDSTVELDRAVAAPTAEDIDAGFPSVSRATIPGGGEVMELSIILDRTSVEIFAGQGSRTLTDLLLASVDRLVLSADGPAQIELLTVRDLGGTE